MYLEITLELAIIAFSYQREQALTVKPTDEEMTELKKWITATFGSEVLPFSFEYGGQSSADLLKTWKVERVSNELDESRTQHTLTYTDSKTGLEVRFVAIEYKDYPAVEWVLFFENTGSQESQILEDVQAANVTFTSKDAGTFVLYHADGSSAVVTDFRPHETNLTPGMTKNFLSYGGRSSDSVLPFFNLTKPDGNGAITAVGWTGQWAASFTRDDGANVNFQAGMELTHLKLYPGEKIRTPAILLLFWSGDYIRGQNQLRRLLLNHFFGGDFYPLTSYSVSQDVWMAWQFNCPEIGEGMVQAFRRKASDTLSYQYRLLGLEPDAQYEFSNLDVLETTKMTGLELMENGLLISIPEQPGAVVLKYKKN